MKKLLTISIAAYNAEPYLEKCLDSLLIPSMDKIEVLIENDGSKDNTASIGQRYEEKYPGVFRLVCKENGGYGSTINKSLELAAGKYFKQLDADDWYDTENLEALVHALEDVNADCVYTPFMEYYEADASQILRKPDVLNTGVQDVAQIAGQNWFLHMHALAFRTEFMREHNVRILEHCFYTDMEYVTYPLLHTKTVYVFDKHIYYYRIGREGQSVSLDGWKKHYPDHIRVIKELLGHQSELDAADPILRQQLIARISGMYRLQIMLFILMKNKKQELAEFDRYIRRNFNDFYNASLPYIGPRVKLLRKTGYLLYPILGKKSENLC